MSSLALRLVTRDDLTAMNDIYNHYVRCSTCTYQTEPEPIEERVAWFESHGPRHPITVVTEGNDIIAWGSLSPFHRRAAYGNTVEDSVYVRHDRHRRGIGEMVLVDLLARAKQVGHRTVIGLISADQTASVKLHEKLGFHQAAHLREVGHKFGRWLDVVYLQKIL